MALELIDPIRSVVIHYIAPEVIGSLQVGFSLGVIIFSFIQKLEDSRLSTFTVWGVFSYVFVVVKVTICFVGVFYGMKVVAHVEGPMPIATMYAFLMLVQQLRMHYYLRMLLALVNAEPPAKPWWETRDIVQIPDVAVITHHRPRSSRH